MIGTSSGFSLVEALIALAISGILLALVTTVFVAQSRYYRDIVERSGLQESVRSVTELAAGEIRALATGSVIVAEESRMVVRTAPVVGVSCGRSGDTYHFYFPLEGVPVTVGDQKSGFGVLRADGDWEFFHRPWGEIYLASGASATVSACTATGTDASAPSSDFVSLYIPPGQAGQGIVSGDLVQLFTTTELRFAPSALRSGQRAFFRGVEGGALVEFATGFAAETRFGYRVGGVWSTEVTGSALEEIDAVRVVIEAVSEDPNSDRGYGWSVDVPLRNTTHPTFGGST